MYNTTVRAMQLLALSNFFSNSKIPLYVLNVTYPLVDDEIKRFCIGKRGVLVIEEGQPDFIEQNVNSILRKADVQTKVHGKGMLPMAGEYTAAAVIRGGLKFVEQFAPEQIDRDHLPSVVRPPATTPVSVDVDGQVHPRPQSFCT